MKRTLSEKEKNELPVYLNPQRLGQKFKEIDVSFLGTGEERVATRWYHGDDADLYLWIDHRSNIVKQQVTFFGQVVEWNIIDSLRTGMVLEEEVGGETQKPSEKVVYDKIFSSSSVKTAEEIIINVGILDDVLKKEVIKNFREPSTFSQMTAEQVVEKYGFTAKQKNDTKVISQIQMFLRKMFT